MGRIIVIYFLLISLCFSHEKHKAARTPANREKNPNSCYELFNNFSSTKNDVIDLPITFEDNQRFINLVKTKIYSNNEVFWHLDNTVLKTLNDQVYGDKEVTHGITIFFQQQMMKNILQNKVLHSKINEKYFDYKTLRLSFKDLNQKEISDEMLKVFVKVNDELEIYLKEKNLIDRLRSAPFLARNFKNWFAQGIGGFPDQAALVARLARTQSQKNISMAHTFETSQKILEKQFVNTQKLNTEVTHLLSYDPKDYIWSVIKINGKEERVLSRDFLDLLRKAEFYTPDGRVEVVRKINLFAGTSLNEKNLDIISQFFNNLNYFSSSVLQKETTKLNWQKAKNGFVSFDFTKKGAEGLQYVHAHMRNAKSIDEALNLSRDGFWQVDRSIKENVEVIKRIVGKENYHSGDDLIIFNENPYKGDQIIKKLHELVVAPQIENMRVVFFRGDQPELFGDRARDVGEMFLKKYRSNLDEIFKRSTQDQVLTFAEVHFDVDGPSIRIFYRIKDSKMEKIIEDWHTKLESQVVFIKI